MAKDFDSRNDMSRDIGNGVSKDTGSDLGDDLASNDGVDLNAGDASKTDSSEIGLAKASMLSDYDAPPPQHWRDIVNDPAPAEIREVPGGKLPSQQALEEQLRMINDGMGPGPENNAEQYPGVEYADE